MSRHLLMIVEECSILDCKFMFSRRVIYQPYTDRKLIIRLNMNHVQVMVIHSDQSMIALGNILDLT